MKELASGKTLENEVLAQAKSRAEANLRQARELGEKLDSEAAEQVRKESGRLEDDYRRRKSLITREWSSKLPLAKRRSASFFLESQIRSAIDEVLGSLELPVVKDLLAKQLRCAAEAFRGQDLVVILRGLGDGPFEGWLEDLLPQAQSRTVSFQGSDHPLDKEIRVRAKDGSISFGTSLTSLKNELLRSRREELVRSLFPQGGFDA